MSEIICHCCPGVPAAQAFLLPRFVPKSVSPRFRQRQAVLVSLPDALFLGFPPSQNTSCMLLPSQFLTIADTFSASSPITVTFQNT
jgi:hypothetical protein